MTLHKFMTLVVLGLAMTMNACSREMQNMTPTHLAQITLASSRYGELLAKLDIEMKAVGLSRYGAAPGLNELRGRDVLYIEYRSKLSDKWTFINATDVIDVGKVEVRIYSAVIKDEKIRKDAMTRVQKVLAEYGTTLKERPTEKDTQLK